MLSALSPNSKIDFLWHGWQVLCVCYSNTTKADELLICVALLDCTVKVFYDDTLKFFLSLYVANVTNNGAYEVESFTCFCVVDMVTNCRSWQWMCPWTTTSWWRPVQTRCPQSFLTIFSFAVDHFNFVYVPALHHPERQTVGTRLWWLPQIAVRTQWQCHGREIFTQNALLFHRRQGRGRQILGWRSL